MLYIFLFGAGNRSTFCGLIFQRQWSITGGKISVTVICDPELEKIDDIQRGNSKDISFLTLFITYYVNNLPVETDELNLRDFIPESRPISVR